MIVLVLGMHKSGTTLLSTILHNSGVNMGEGFEVGTYDTGNQFERAEMLDINMRLLNTNDDQTLKLSAPSHWDVNDDIRAEIQQLIAICENRYSGKNGGKSWGMKDPRTALTYDVWKSELPAHKLVAIYRPPEQIWARYRWRGWRRRYVNLYWAWLFLNRWYEHNQGMLNAVQGNDEDYYLVNYLDFMADEKSVETLSKYLGQPLVDERQSKMFRSTRKYDWPLSIAKWALKVFKARDIDKLVAQLNQLSRRSIDSGAQ